MAMRDYILKLARSVSSFASRVSLEPESESLKTTTAVELQKLTVTPQTIFLKTPSGDVAARPTRLLPTSRPPSDLASRASALGTPRSHRTMSIDHSAGIAPAPFEDLRRRLAAINSSATSLSVSPSLREPRSPTIPFPEPHPLPSALDTPVSDVPLERPSSPSESVTSSTFRGATQFLHSVDGQKAAPAVGSSKANAVGLLDAHSAIHPEGGTPDRSSSPVSVAGTIRGTERAFPPISSYGEFIHSIVNSRSGPVNADPM